MTNTDDTLEATLKDYIAEEALNIAIAYLQEQFGVTNGDYAAHFFDDETAEKIKTIFKDYIEGELDQQFSGKSE
jgi:hypothetical protein